MNQKTPNRRVFSADPLDVEAEVRRQHTLLCRRIDHNFAWLMLLQWAAAIAIALWVSPLAWAGDHSYLHPHVTLALWYGGVLTLLPVFLIRIAPGERSTRFTIAVTQMLMSALLIHLSGGRIETHFHIFGSLAFLAFYMDWQVLVLASAVIALDHYLRGVFFPFSVFGVASAEPWRWLEHVAWVVFFDIFLILGCSNRLRSLREAAARHIERAALLRRAHFDALTGLPNRSYLSEWMAEAILEANGHKTCFSCLYIDLDRFKEINDQVGHSGGDSLLVEIAARIKSRLDDGAFLARIASDEFVAVVLESGPHPIRGEEVARSILRAFSQPFAIEETQLALGVSIGICVYPRDGSDESELLLRCDQAMYRVKRVGRNHYLTYAHHLFAAEADRIVAESDLLRAIKHGELALHYQPIFRTGGLAGFRHQIVGVEALMRWTHPQRGNISPAQFIPLAEETGLIVRLGTFALHEACKQASDWRHRGLLPGSIAVNVSSLQLAREDFAESVILTLRQHYTPADAIELEVTESALMMDFALAERHLRQLREFGIRIAIDDFGTGYSSLGRLRQLTLDTLKIDRLFVEGVATSEADRTVVEHIIAMAHTLGMKVVAEGVETETQLQTLCALDCDQLQGFLLGRPQNREKTEALLQGQTTPQSPSLPAA
jgi:diguanylate cyclase (GGDEF)-like protein